MIPISSLSEDSKAHEVTYRGFDHREYGYITSWNDKFIFVRYHLRVSNDGTRIPRYGQTSEATSPDDLDFSDRKAPSYRENNAEEGAGSVRRGAREAWRDEMKCGCCGMTTEEYRKIYPLRVMIVQPNSYGLPVGKQFPFARRTPDGVEVRGNWPAYFHGRSYLLAEADVHAILEAV